MRRMRMVVWASLYNTWILEGHGKAFVGILLHRWMDGWGVGIGFV